MKQKEAIEIAISKFKMILGLLGCLAFMTVGINAAAASPFPTSKKLSVFFKKSLNSIIITKTT